MNYKRIHLIDTAIASDNVGDEIIVEACRAGLTSVLSDAYVTTSSGHDGLGYTGRKLAAAADIVFLLGTNALSATRTKWRHHFIWHVAGKDMAALGGKVVLFGVGAHRAFASVQPAQVRFLRGLLSQSYVHSVRDDTGLAILRACELSGINTGCPTLWRAIDVVVPRQKAPAVCFTLTAHKADPLLDRHLVEILSQNYAMVWFWPQQPGDLEYLRSLGLLDRVKGFIPPNLAAYDDILSSQDIDVIGTRLHGTIRGLLHERRSIVIAIDNRAKDLGSFAHLPLVMREEIPDQLERTINGSWPTRLTLDLVKRDQFLAQFLREKTAPDAFAVAS